MDYELWVVVELVETIGSKTFINTKTPKEFNREVIDSADALRF